jgi:transcriptional regulator with XRE-family HTH domain
MDREEFLRRLGARFRHTRERKGMTQRELSAKSGVGKTQLCQYEQGHHAPSLATFLCLVEALEVTPNDVLTGLRPPPASPYPVGKRS